MQRCQVEQEIWGKAEENTWPFSYVFIPSQSCFGSKDSYQTALIGPETLASHVGYSHLLFLRQLAGPQLLLCST
jgi:hypothetical protein